MSGRARSAHLFPTHFGTLGVSWGERGVRALQLPEVDERRLLARLRSRDGAPLTLAAPPPAVVDLVRRLQRHLAGEPDPLRDVVLDEEGLGEFARRVHAAARGVGPGRTVSYGELARRVGVPGGAQAAGQVLARNPFPLVVPCHRVLAADGGLGGFSAHGATATKLRLLTVEGVDLAPLATAGVRQLRHADPRLGAIIRRVGRYRLAEQQRGDRFTALAEAIVHQQVSMAAGATIFRRLREALGGGAALDPRRLKAAAVPVLRAAGVSRQKTSYLRDLAARTTSGALPLAQLDRLDDERVIELLTQVQGIGRWSAEMFLLFRLGRLDVLPVGDLGLRRGVQLVYGLRQAPDPAAVRRRAAAWAPYRSIATWYLWRALEVGGLA